MTRFCCCCQPVASHRAPCRRPDAGNYCMDAAAFRMPTCARSPSTMPGRLWACWAFAAPMPISTNCCAWRASWRSGFWRTVRIRAGSRSSCNVRLGSARRLAGSPVCGHCRPHLCAAQRQDEAGPLRRPGGGCLRRIRARHPPRAGHRRGHQSGQAPDGAAPQCAGCLRLPAPAGPARPKAWTHAALAWRASPASPGRWRLPRREPGQSAA